MEAIVHQALGHVFGHHAAGVFQATQIQNAFMRYMACFAIGACAGVERWVVIGQSTANVVGRQNGRLSRVLQTFCAHHAAVHPADGQYSCIAQRCGRHGAYAVDF